MFNIEPKVFYKPELENRAKNDKKALGVDDFIEIQQVTWGWVGASAFEVVLMLNTKAFSYYTTRSITDFEIIVDGDSETDGELNAAILRFKIPDDYQKLSVLYESVEKDHIHLLFVKGEAILNSKCMFACFGSWARHTGREDGKSLEIKRSY